MRCLLSACAACFAAAAWGGESPSAPKPSWEFALTAYPTAGPDKGDNYTSVVATADRGPLRLEARYSYEAVDSRSAFVGWTFSGGETLSWEIRPLLGGVWGPIDAIVPAIELSLAWGRFDFYLEGEYVDDGDEPYTYAWSELGYAPFDWLRIGMAAQRTRILGDDRDIQRGPFAQLSWELFTVGAYWFKPGADDQVFVTSFGVSF